MHADEGVARVVFLPQQLVDLGAEAQAPQEIRRHDTARADRLGESVDHGPELGELESIFFERLAQGLDQSLGVQRAEHLQHRRLLERSWHEAGGGGPGGNGS
jgi:hypothetical protein